MMVVLFFVSIAIGAGLATCAKAAEPKGTATVLDGDDIMLTFEGGQQRVQLSTGSARNASMSSQSS